MAMFRKKWNSMCLPENPLPSPCFAHLPHFSLKIEALLIYSAFLSSHTLYRYEDIVLHGKNCEKVAIFLQKRYILIAASL